MQKEDKGFYLDRGKAEIDAAEHNRQHATDCPKPLGKDSQADDREHNADAAGTRRVINVIAEADG